MAQNLDFLRFDFEKLYLGGVHDWSRSLMNQFKNKKYDDALRSSMTDGLVKLNFLTSQVENGNLCGHRTILPPDVLVNLEKYLTWERNDDGRLWSGCKLTVFDHLEEHPMKLKKLLKTEIETLRELLKYRKVVLGAFTDYGYPFAKKYKKNLFKDGVKLDEKVREYRDILKTEILLRREIHTSLVVRKKGLGSKHRALLKTLTEMLNKVTLTLCYEKSELKECQEELDSNNSCKLLIKNCAQCKQPKDLLAYQ